jgi:hypothetical protein
MKRNGFPQPGWLPPGKRCAILFSIDDVHPSDTQHGADAGGDLGQGMLGNLERLIAAHPQLRTSLCTTPDWRSRVPYPTRRVLARLGPLANLFYLAPRWPAGTFALDRHPGFVAYLQSLPRTEIVPHGLHHIRKGQPMPIEFGRASEGECAAALAEIDAIMTRAGIAAARGLSPPGWEAPRPLRQAMRRHGLEFVASARDVQTPISREATTAMSGMSGQPLIYPGITEEDLIHIPTNFQATSPIERALAVLECGGLLSVKAHAIKRIGSYVSLDGLDEAYAETLDRLFRACHERFGEAIWWASMGEIAAQTRSAMAGEAAA